MLEGKKEGQCLQLKRAVGPEIGEEGQGQTMDNLAGCGKAYGFSAFCYGKALRLSVGSEEIGHFQGGMLSGISQMEKVKNHMISLICEI